MTPERTSARDAVASDDLKTLASARGPCISLALSIPHPLQIHARVRNGIREVEKRLREKGIDDSTAEWLAEPIRSLAADAELEKIWASGLMIYRSPDLFRYFSLYDSSQWFVEIGDRFQIRPLLPMIAREQRFLLLALSRKHVRLFRGTHRGLEQMELAGIPESLEQWMNARMPDHVLENRSTGGASVGSMRGVMFGTSTDRERRGEYVHHFFKEVDNGIRHALHGEADPLILAGVDEETAIYRRINSYGRLIDRSVRGSPDGVPAAELHQRAMEIIQSTRAPALEKLLHDFEQNRGSRRTVVRVEAAMKAASQGLVSGIVLADNGEYRGSFDEATGRMGAGEEDLLNLVALTTVQYGGEAFSLPAEQLPAGAEVAALLRG